MTFATGCNWISAGAIILSPPRIEKAQYKLTTERLAVFIDYAKPDEENPVFDRALQSRLMQIASEQPKHFKCVIVPYDEILAQRRDNPGFARWSVQRVGQSVDAEEVLYLRVESLQLRPTPDYPLIEPKVKATLKVIGVSDPPDNARRWPPEERGRALAEQRMAEEAAGSDALDDAAAKLARQLAEQIAYPFYDVNLEERPPKEP